MSPSFPPFEPAVKLLETPRLIIRIDTEEDYTRLINTGSDAQITAYLGLNSAEELLLHKTKVQGGLSTYRTSVVLFYLIEREHKKVIGSFSFHNWYPAHRRAEIGYMMTAEECKGMGFMKEAIGPVIAFGFEAMDLNRIEAFIHPENLPSRKLVERRGFRQEGWLHEHYCKNGLIEDSLVYGLLRKDYAAVST